MRARTTRAARPARPARPARLLMSVAALTSMAAVSGCSMMSTSSDEESGDGTETVTLVTHESFSLPEELIAAFERDSGLALEIAKLEDAGALTNELVLTKDQPVGDVVFGIDNTFATRAIDEGVFEPYAAALPAGAEAHVLPGDGERALTPIDTGSVCVNVDEAWFAANGIEAPTTIDQLTDAAYQDLLVVPGAATSSPGLAFLLSTVGRYGEEWPTYWADLMANGAKVVGGWSDAYYTDFTFSGGDRPIVVSYDSSPAFTLDESGTASTTSALLDSCFQQVEYAGVLRGDEEDDVDSEGAQAVIDWLLSAEVQAALPESMYVFPVAADTELPADWAQFAPRPTETVQVDPAEIAAQRQAWIEEWNEIVSR